MTALRSEDSASRLTGIVLMPSEKYTVRVTKDYLVFCSGHFITYDGDQCERLHGHNYRAAIELEGPLDANFYLFDFVALKNMGRKLTDELDHFMMVPTKNPHIRVEDRGESVRVLYKEREWVFPRSECVLLPIENTTAELLARYMGKKLLNELVETHRFTPDVMRIEIEESFGQSATYEWKR